MTLRLVSLDTLAPSVKLLETADRETPAWRATSLALMGDFSRKIFVPKFFNQYAQPCRN
jgi:hypothetical protein